MKSSKNKYIRLIDTEARGSRFKDTLIGTASVLGGLAMFQSFWEAAYDTSNPLFYTFVTCFVGSVAVGGRATVIGRRLTQTQTELIPLEERLFSKIIANYNASTAPSETNGQDFLTDIFENNEPPTEDLE